MDIKKLQEKFLDKSIKVEDYILDIFNKIEKQDYNAFITLNKEDALEQAKKVDLKIKNKDKLGPMFGIPFGIKDNILTKGLRTTGSTKILKNFVPVYNASLIESIREKDGIIIGKTNMDELAMGASSETSFFGPTLNPFDTDLVPGGSSSGSAAAVAGGLALVGLGTDTGGSCRNPANYCNVVGFAPSYGAISRYGVISMCNSFDRVGIIANTVGDVRLVFDAIRGKDRHDLTSLDLEEDFEEIDFKRLKIAAINLNDEFKFDQQVRDNYVRIIEYLKFKGVEVEMIDLDLLNYINQVYTVIMAVEVSANMARLDGLRYGEAVENYDNYEDLFKKNRSTFLGEEVQRRIALGNYFSSKEDNQREYIQAMKIRKMIKDEIEKVFSNFDFFISPTNTNLPPRVGETISDANAAFDTGTFNTITNLANFPSISLPVDKERLGSIQVISDRNTDLRLLAFADMLEGGLVK